MPLHSADHAPTLVVVAHGTRRPEGPRCIDALLDRVRSLRPGLRVEAAYVELVEPSLPEVLDRAGRRNSVVVPLLLGNGYHLVHDVAAVAAPAPVAPALGPHHLLAVALADRLREAGDRGTGPIVLAGAGSSDRQSRADTEAMGRLLAARLGRRVVVAYNTTSAPRVSEAVAALRAEGRPSVSVVTYLLAPGRFSYEVAECGAEAVSAPLGTHDAVARLILARYDAARFGIAVVDPPARTLATA